MTRSSILRFLRLGKPLICLAVAATVAGTSSGLQESQARKGVAVIEGTVSDVSGAVIPGVALRLEFVSSDAAPNKAAVVETTSDAEGKFVLAVPASGRYRLQAKKEFFQQLVVNDIDLAAGVKRDLDLVLKIAATTVPVSVCCAKSVPAPQLSDTPTFTVAGVTDYNNVGLHGSDANVRTSDALSKETATLKASGGKEDAPSSGAGDTHRLAGDGKEKNGDPMGAMQEYQTAVKLDPSEENYFALGAELLLHRAGLAAVEIFRKGAEAHPESARMHAGLGAAYYADGQYAEAAGQMCKASDINPADPQPYLFLGKMEKAAADLLPCSEEKLKRLVQEQPGNALANYYYGLVLWKNARKTQNPSAVSEAEQRLRKAAEIDSSLGEAYLQLGILYNALGKKDAALAEFQKAVAASPKLPAARYQLSLAYRRSGDAAKADQEMKTYDGLRRSEDAELDKEHREMRQFVTILKDNRAPAPH